MGLYEELAAVDVMDPIAELLNSRRMRIDPNTQRAAIDFQSITPKPWVYAGIDRLRECSLWKDFIFEHFKIIHPGCFSCWKICFRPATLEKLFATMRLQHSMKEQTIPGTDREYHSKCGIERRSYVGAMGGYGAFWYAPLDLGLDVAREVHKNVEKRVHAEVDANVSVILKRGCTEFEMMYSPSDKWEEMAENGNWETKIRMVESITPDYKRPMIEDYSMSVIHSQKMWIEHAARHGDMTYMKYSDHRLHPELLDV